MTRKPKRAALSKAEADAMLRELADGAAKIFVNAEALYNEASVLHKAGAISRSYFLHQISLEECAKIEMLGAWAVSVLTDMEIDTQRLTLAWASHKAKNYTNAYQLPVSKAESDARREKRWGDAMTAFKQQQADFHLESNTAKNVSLYVNLENGIFTAPSERISDEMVTKIADTNREFLAAAHAKTEMMRRWLNDPDKVRDMMQWFETRLKKLMSQSEDPTEALSVVLEEMLPRAKETGYAKAMKIGANRDKTDN